MATDRRAVWGCAATIRSVVENVRPGASLRFLVATQDVLPQDKAKLSASALRDDVNAEVDVFDFDPGLVENALTSKNIPYIAYAWLFIDHFLPESAERCVCIDVDLLFELDIAELASIELEGRTIGAVSDGDREYCRKATARLGLPGDRYLNSGVLVIDMRRWREVGYGELAVAYATNRKDVFGAHDQDAINVVVEGDWVELDGKWNAWASRLEEDHRDRVCHFTSVPKPWHADYPETSLRDRFFEYLDQTPYRGSRPWNLWGLGVFAHRARRRIPYLPKVYRLLKTKLRGGVET